MNHFESCGLLNKKLMLKKNLNFSLQKWSMKKKLNKLSKPIPKPLTILLPVLKLIQKLKKISLLLFPTYLSLKSSPYKGSQKESKKLNKKWNLIKTKWVKKDLKLLKINKDWIFLSNKSKTQSKRFSKLSKNLLKRKPKKDKKLKVIWKNLLEISSKKLLLLTKKVSNFKSKTKHLELKRNKSNKKWPLFKLISERKLKKRIKKSRRKKSNLW